MQPALHLYLREHFLYYDRKRVYLHGGHGVELERSERSVVECLLRGEGELGVLANSLSRLEIGGEPAELAQQVLDRYSGQTSLIGIGQPMQVIEPEVIVCSFSPDLAHLDVRRLVRRLRRRHRVLHIGTAEHVRGDRRANRGFKEGPRQPIRSLFQFVQWARSLVRFHTRAVLILTGVQDMILFADLAATHRSVLTLSEAWPPRVGLQDLLGSKAVLKDPLPGLVALYYALRMTPLKELGRITYATSSELAWLELYALRHAQHVACARADQPAQLERLGRGAEEAVPLCIAPGKLRPVRIADSAGQAFAVVFDMNHFDAAAPVLRALYTAAKAAGFETVVVRCEHGWLDVQVDKVIKVLPRSEPPESVGAALLLPGLTSSFGPSVDTLLEGVPTLCYPTTRAHPLVEGAEAPWLTAYGSAADWAGALRAVRTDGPLRRASMARARELASRWDLVARVSELAAEDGPTPPERTPG